MLDKPQGRCERVWLEQEHRPHVLLGPDPGGLEPGAGASTGLAGIDSDRSAAVSGAACFSWPSRQATGSEKVTEQPLHRERPLYCLAPSGPRWVILR